MADISKISLFDKETEEQVTYDIADEDARARIATLEINSGNASGGGEPSFKFRFINQRVSATSYGVCALNNQFNSGKDFVVDWGDGTVETNSFFHEYSTSIVGNICIYGIKEVRSTYQSIIDTTQTTISIVYAYINCSCDNTVGLFKGLTSLEGAVFAPASSYYKQLPINAFEGCTNLTNVICPDVRIISQGAFLNCSSLKNITLDGVVEIQSNVFEGCSSLVSMNIPASVTTFGANIFKNCTNLRKLVFKDRYEVFNYPTNFLENVHKDIIFVFENLQVATAFRSNSTWESAYGTGEYMDKYKGLVYATDQGTVS